MDIDRRQVLIGTVGAVLAGSIGGVGPSPPSPDIPDADRWHPLTHSLLERAPGTNLRRMVPDRPLVERTIRQLAAISGWTKPLAIKWMGTPADAFDHLSRLGLDALLDMGTTGFWRRFQPPASGDVDTFDHAFEVRMVANELLGVDEHDRLLIAPKLGAKAHAISANASDQEVFRVRAGWLETSMADAAAQAVSNVELLLSAGASEGSVAIDHQLKIFASHECGLLATWETTAELLCAPRLII
jgi:hypothetical protein